MFRKRRSAIEPSDRKVTDRERSREKTMNRAVKLLAAKPRSIGELRERLLEKPWTDDAIVDAVIEKLKEYKYLDDEQYARDLAVSKLRQKPQGERLLRFSMSRKQLDKDVVEAAVADAFDRLPESELLDNALAKRLRLKGKPQTREDTKKFYDHLMRQGFDYGLIREKMDSLIKGAYDDDDQS